MRRRLGNAVVLGAPVLGASPGPAFAHADAAGSTPRQGAVVSDAPRTLTVRFNEPVALDPSAPVILTDRHGTVPSTTRLAGPVLTVSPSAPMARGPAWLTWHVISEDGHPTSGALAFQIGRASARGPALRIATTPAVPATVSGSRPGPLSIAFGRAVSDGEVEWTNDSVDGPLTWRVGSGTSRAVGVLPVAGTWRMKAVLVADGGTVVIVTGSVVLRG